MFIYVQNLHFSDALVSRLNNQTNEISMIDDIWKMTMSIQENVLGINVNQQEIKGER
jgi:hypothetical protein